MSIQREFYRERAAEARASSLAATLQNVRDRWAQAEATWTELLKGSERAERRQDKLIANNANERAAVQAARPAPTNLPVASVAHGLFDALRHYNLQERPCRGPPYFRSSSPKTKMVPFASLFERLA